jgi:hypothetical protein
MLEMGRWGRGDLEAEQMETWEMGSRGDGDGYGEMLCFFTFLFV